MRIFFSLLSMPPQPRSKQHGQLELGQHGKKTPSFNSKAATSSNLRTKKLIPMVNYSKFVGHTEEGGKICKKRSGDVHLELPCKHRRVSKDESDKLFSMVEAVYQPRQTH